MTGFKQRAKRRWTAAEQESARVEQAKTIVKESALEVEEEDNILAKKVGKYSRKSQSEKKERKW